MSDSSAIINYPSANINYPSANINYPSANINYTIAMGSIIVGISVTCVIQDNVNFYRQLTYIIYVYNI